ncbi:MAG TPA: DUF222 domain-containing protein [Mycobacteriales bacterium]|nr:DUF222 domain-containing protein [Mycobacteriales bacterium]
MFDSVALAEPPDASGNDWPVVMAEGMGPCGAALNLLAGVHPEYLSESARASALAQLAAITSHAEAVRLRLTAAVAGPKPEDRAEDWGAHDVAAANRCSLYAADRQIAFARDLAGRLSATAEAMLTGRITQRQAQALFEGVAHLPDELAQEIEERLLRFSHRQDLTLFKTALRRWLARLDPSWRERAESARRRVFVDHAANDNGTGDFNLRGPLESTALVDTALSAYAKANKATLGGTTAERKLTALTEWAEAYLTGPNAPRRHGRAIGINVCLDAPTMFGLAQHPAEIPGYGMVPAEAAIHLLADGSPLRRLIIDPDDGHLLSYGRKTYVVPPALTEHLAALFVTSAGLHSNVPAAECDIDHNLPHGQGGGTDPDNNAPLDRRWHRAKTHADWTWTYNPDRSITWISPTGLAQTVQPHDYRLGP